MDASSSTTDKYKCSICFEHAFEQSRDGEGRYLGKTVKLDCTCKFYYHYDCLKEFWDTPVCATSNLEADDLPLACRAVYDDMLVSGVNPDTFEFVDVPVFKSKRCPVCAKSVLEFTDVRYEAVLAADDAESPARAAAQCKVSDPPADSGASGLTVKDCAPVKLGSTFNMHNMRAVVSDLKSMSLIPTELKVNEVELLDFINNKMANMDLKDRGAEKCLVDFLKKPASADQVTVSSAETQPPEPEKVSSRQCSRLTPTEIRDWVDDARASGWIGEHVKVEVDLLCSFIMYELADKNFNSHSTQKRIIQFINSQVTGRFRMPDVFF